AMFHITFPVVNRASFGLFGSLWCVFNRAAMACIWWGVQAWIGGQCMEVMLRSIFPGTQNIKNSMSASSGTNTRDFMCFFLYWLISLPVMWPEMHKIRHVFTAKAIFAPTAGIIFFIWSIVKAKGVGPIIHQPSTLHGSALGWQMVISTMSCVSNMATLITNAPDFASRAHRPRDAVWPQIIGIPLGFSLVSFLGIIVSSSSQVIYGEPVWSPIDLLGNLLNDNPSHATRFGVWFISASFILAQIGTNIAANSVSAGCDLTALFPRFINIRRGGYVAAIVGLAMCPWNLLKACILCIYNSDPSRTNDDCSSQQNSNSFTSYLSAYSVFLSSIAGVMISDYWVVRKGHIRVADFYTTKRDGWYYYTFGVNFRAYAAYVCGILINVVGFAGAVGTKVPLAATRIYELSFFTGFGVSAIVYIGLNYFFPVPGSGKSFEEVDESDFRPREQHKESTDDDVHGSEKYTYGEDDLKKD
ncbi:hypothetical protein FRB97_003006, partial [Tulasnella sp. 331]